VDFARGGSEEICRGGLVAACDEDVEMGMAFAQKLQG